LKKISFLVITVSIFMVSLIPTNAFGSSGVLDQSNGPGINSSQIKYFEPCGQQFVPAMPILTGVELFIYSSMNAMGDSTITINIHPDSITDIPIATQSYIIPSNSPKSGTWIYFEYATPVSVIPGSTYVLEVDSDTSYHMWYSTGNTYSDGAMIKQGSIDTNKDWSFRTYGASTISIASSIYVDIDIKPGGDPNSINLRSKGVVPVALLTTIGFVATTIDPETVIFAGAMPIKWSTKDVDSDGDVDVVFHFKTRELNLDSSSTDATLTGKTFNPVFNISGTGSVKIVNGKN